MSLIRTEIAALLAAALLAAGGAAAADHGEHADAKPVKVATAAPVPPPAAPVAAIDPLEQLRQRLADRLSTGKAAETAGPYDLRVTPRAPAAAKPLARGAKGELGHGAHAAKGDAAHAGGPPHWGYEGAAGPGTWAALNPDFALCASGQRQSPIDIRGGLPVDLEPVHFEYQASNFGVIDNGHTVQVNVAPGNYIEVGGRRFGLVQFHFHRPSEERIDGRQFELSLHLVHKDDQGRLAVVALLFDKGPAQPVLQKVWANLPLERNEEAPARVPLELGGLLPADRRYYTYMGSLTTPPCSEGVQWIVMRQPVTLAPEQIDIFARMYPMNARPVQAVAGRRILQSGN